VRVATWNINGLRARLELVLRWLRDRAPDVVGLQELKLTDEKFPAEAFASAGYQASSHGQKAWNGVAILSRKPLEVLQRGLPGQEERGARLLTAVVDELSFTTVYCPNGKTLDHPDFASKLEWFDALARHFAETRDPQRPEILCGDFNVCPAPLDSFTGDAAAGEIFHTDAERERYAALLQWGLIDVFRDRHPESRDFSWWDYRGGAFHRGQGLRIDMVLGTRAVSERVQSIHVDREYRKKLDGLTPSDHAPVIADLA